MLERAQQPGVDREIATALRIAKELDSHIMNEVPQQQERSGKPGPKRGLGQKAFEILDAIPVGQTWTTQTLTEKLAVHGLTTTQGAIQQMLWTYRQQRRPAVVTRKPIPGSKGSYNSYHFEVPAPTEPVKTVSMPQDRRAKYVAQAEQRAQELRAFKEELKEDPKPIPMVEPYPPAMHKPGGLPTSRPMAKPAPTPGLSNAEINRAFNDFQAFMLEALMDFRNELLKMRK